MMTTKKRRTLKDFFKDKNGRIVLWQQPNLLLYGWIILTLLTLVLTNEQLKTGCEQLSTAFLFAWAYLEATKGVSHFRRLLGIIVLIVVILSYFK